MKKLLTLTLLTLFALNPAFAASDRTTGYVIYIDAGSTGTRLHLYKYKTESFLAPVVIEIPLNDPNPNAGNSNIPMDSFRQNPGEAGLRHPTDVGDQLLKNLLDLAKKTIDQVSQDTKTPIREVPVYLLGTAGMRSMADGNRAGQIYKNAKDYVKKYSAANDNIFDVPDASLNDNTQNFQNLDGKKEALFGWLDINYQAGNLQVDPKTLKTIAPKNTLGNIDFGGASLEVAFETPSNNVSKWSDSFKIGNKQYYVFILSFSDLGQKKAREAVITNPNGYHCFPQGSTLTSKISQNGDYSFSDCRDVFAAITQKDEWTDQINAIPASKKEVQFLAHSGVNSTFKFFKLIDSSSIARENLALGSSQFTQGALEDALNDKKSSWCTNKKNIANIRIDDLEKFCPNGVFIDYFLLRTGLVGSQITVGNKIDGKKIEWTLGAVISGLVTHNNT